MNPKYGRRRYALPLALALVCSSQQARAQTADLIAAADDGESGSTPKKKKKHRHGKDEEAGETAAPEANTAPPYGPAEKQSSPPPVMAPVAAPAPAPAPTPVLAPAPEVVSTPYVAPEPPSAGRDHDAHMGHWALAAFTTPTVLVGSVNTAAGAAGAPAVTLAGASLLAPAIGVRYWFSHFNSFDLGFEAGIGLNINGSTTTSELVVNTTTTTTTQGALSPSAFFLHLGVPMELFGSKHYGFDIIPQLNLGFGWASTSLTAAANGGTAATLSTNGVLVEFGVSAGPEITFGYFDMPQLVIQPTVGLLLHHDNYSGTETAGTAKATQTVSDNAFFTLNSTAAVSVFYYF